jgi:hypothetical protein
VITPGFFRSKPCRDELARFLAREKSLGRSDLVLPVYYINCPTLNDEVKRAGDDLAQAIYEHQYADWSCWVMGARVRWWSRPRMRT